MPPSSTSLKWEPHLTLKIRYLSTLVYATCCHVYLSHGEGVVPVHLDGYTNMSQLLNRVTNIRHCIRMLDNYSLG